MNWPEFIQKVSTYKNAKIIEEKLNAATAMRLIFSGAFDSMVAPEDLKKHTIVPTYLAMVEELLAALKSSAKLPKAKKEDLVGLDEIRTLNDLNCWRYTNNPLVTYDLGAQMERELANIGWFPNPKSPTGGFKLSRSVSNGKDPAEEKGGPPTYLVSGFQALYENEKQHGYIQAGKVRIAVLGVTTSVERKELKNGSESMLIRLFTGVEETAELRIWSEYSTRKMAPKYKALAVNQHGIALISPDIWMGKPSPILLNWTYLPLTLSEVE